MSLPILGATRQRLAIDISVRSGNTDSDSRSAVYQPDEGWMITNYTVTTQVDFGETSKSVSYVQANSSVSTAEEIRQTFDFLIDGAARKGLAEYAAKLRIERDKAIAARHSISSSHRALVAELRCQGQGIFGGGAKLDIDVRTDELFVGSSRILENIKAFHLAAIDGATPIERIVWSGSSSLGATSLKKEGHEWVEYQHGNAGARFTEQSRDSNFVYLFDSSRGMWVALGLSQMFWRQGNSGSWNYIYEGKWDT